MRWTPHSYHEKITTVHQFVQTGYHWGAPQPAWAYSIRHAQVPDDLAMYRRFESHSNEELHNRSFSRTYGIAIERLHAGSYSFNDYVQMDALSKQDVRTGRTLCGARRTIHVPYLFADDTRGRIL